jgi:hypothetical protein
LFVFLSSSSSPFFLLFFRHYSYSLAVLIIEGVLLFSFFITQEYGKNDKNGTMDEHW